MKAQIIISFLLISLIVSTGCIQVSSQTNSCSDSGGFVGVSYLERTYLWGDDGFMTKKYDVTISIMGLPQVKTGISQYELNVYVDSYCKATQTIPMTNVPVPYRKYTEQPVVATASIQPGQPPRQYN